MGLCYVFFFNGHNLFIHHYVTFCEVFFPCHRSHSPRLLKGPDEISDVCDDLRKLSSPCLDLKWHPRQLRSLDAVLRGKPPDPELVVHQ